MHIDEPILNTETSLANPEFTEKFSHFLARTPTVYSSAPIQLLADRGIENRLLDNLLQFLPNGAIISGGFALSIWTEEKSAKDIDFFFTSEKAFLDMLELFKNPPEEAWAYKGYDVSNISFDETSRYVLLKHTSESRPAAQLLKMVWYADASHVIDSFDFTIIQLAFTKDTFVFNGLAFLDIARKRLVLHRMQFPASTLRRIIKYSAKGYYACPGSLARICEEIQQYKGDSDVNSVVYVD